MPRPPPELDVSAVLHSLGFTEALLDTLLSASNKVETFTLCRFLQHHPSALRDALLKLASQTPCLEERERVAMPPQAAIPMSSKSFDPFPQLRSPSPRVTHPRMVSQPCPPTSPSQHRKPSTPPPPRASARSPLLLKHAVSPREVDLLVEQQRQLGLPPSPKAGRGCTSLFHDSTDTAFLEETPNGRVEECEAPTESIHATPRQPDPFPPSDTFDEVKRLSRWLRRSLEKYGLSSPSPLQRRCLSSMTAGCQVLTVSGRASGRATAIAIAALARMNFESKTLQVLIVCREPSAAAGISRMLRTFLGMAIDSSSLSTEAWDSIVTLMTGANKLAADVKRLRDLQRGDMVLPPPVTSPLPMLALVATPRRLAAVLAKCDGDPFSGLRFAAFHWTQSPLVSPTPRMACPSETAPAWDPLAAVQEDVSAVHYISSRIPRNTPVSVLSDVWPTILKTRTVFRNDEPVRIEIPPEQSGPPHGLRQFHVVVPEQDKLATLVNIAREKCDPMLVICCTKRKVEIVASYLSHHRISQGRVAYIHPDLPPSMSSASLAAFASGSLSILIATDAIADGGVEQLNVKLLVAFDFPVSGVAHIKRLRLLDTSCTTTCITFCTQEDRRGFKAGVLADTSHVIAACARDPSSGRKQGQPPSPSSNERPPWTWHEPTQPTPTPRRQFEPRPVTSTKPWSPQAPWGAGRGTSSPPKPRPKRTTSGSPKRRRSSTARKGREGRVRSVSIEKPKAGTGHTPQKGRPAKLPTPYVMRKAGPGGPSRGRVPRNAPEVRAAGDVDVEVTRIKTQTDSEPAPAVIEHLRVNPAAPPPSPYIEDTATPMTEPQEPDAFPAEPPQEEEAPEEQESQSGVELQPDEWEKFSEMFSRADADGDGVLNFREAQWFTRNTAGIEIPLEAYEMMTKGSAGITFTQARALLPEGVDAAYQVFEESGEVGTTSEDMLHEMFAWADADGNGLLDLSEMQTLTEAIGGSAIPREDYEALCTEFDAAPGRGLNPSVLRQMFGEGLSDAYERFRSKTTASHGVSQMPSKASSGEAIMTSMTSMSSTSEEAATFVPARSLEAHKPKSKRASMEAELGGSLGECQAAQSGTAPCDDPTMGRKEP